MEPEIRFCTTSDGISIGYATMGQGSPPLVHVPNWFSPFKAISLGPGPASDYERQAASQRLVLYDRRGTGISDRNVHDFSRGALVRDLEAVTDQLRLRSVVLMAWDMAGPAAIEYAFRHPQRTSRLVLMGCYPRGTGLGGAEAREGLLALLRGGWDVGSEMLPGMVMSGQEPEEVRRYFTALRESCSGAVAAAQLEATFAEDVTDLLPHIEVPALVLHGRHDRLVPFALGRELASLMPNGRLVALDWDAHWDPSGSDRMYEAIEGFLAEGRKPDGSEFANQAMPSGSVTILFTDMEGSTTLTQSLGDAKAQDILRVHNSIVRDALKAHSGSETKHTGDGIMASFPSASKALEAAVAMQKAFADHAQENTDTPIRVRIGLNAGEPVAEDDDLFGTAVQLAARVCAQAEPGQILTSNVVQELAAGKGFDFADKGEATLKGFEKPVRLHEVRWRDGN